MGDSLLIRRFRATDLEAVLAIAVAAWEPIFASIRRALGDELFALFIPDWQADKRRAVREACDPGSPARVCVAEVDGDVVGFATYYADAASGAGEIGNNAVHPEYQGRGIGTSMYEYIFDRLRDLGMRCVSVETGGDDSHARARRAYERAGFGASFPTVRYYRQL